MVANAIWQTSLSATVLLFGPLNSDEPISRAMRAHGYRVAAAGPFRPFETETKHLLLNVDVVVLDVTNSDHNILKVKS